MRLSPEEHKAAANDAWRLLHRAYARVLRDDEATHGRNPDHVRAYEALTHAMRSIQGTGAHLASQAKEKP